MPAPLLRVTDLRVTFATPDGDVDAVRGLGYELAPRETLGIVGESGSGKSQSVLALMGLLADNGRATGQVVFDGQPILDLPEARLNEIRGRRIAMIFQDPMTSLNPYLRIGEQMAEVLRLHEGMGRRAARARCVEMLDAVHITEARRRLDMYPHELSGGMRQRVMIASALLCRPQILIADEPTTALDVTVQAQILALMRELREKFDTAIILITHDLGIVAGNCDRVLVMQNGVAVESGTTDAIFYATRDPYTRALLGAVPRLDAPAGALPGATVTDPPVMSARGLRVAFPVAADGWFAPPRTLRAVDDVSLTINSAETLGVVGESGCGKSTLARALLQLVPVTGGRVALLGRDLGALDRRSLRYARRDMQLVLQDPLAALNPRMTVRDIVTEPLETFHPDGSRQERVRRAGAMLERVGLDAAMLNRYPHEFSGGQCQRIGIARALILEPRILLLDEPTSALDVSVQAEVLNLLQRLKQEYGLTYILVSHNLTVIAHMCDALAVMNHGAVVEELDVEQLKRHDPTHPYTRQLMVASLGYDREAIDRFEDFAREG